MIEIRMYILHAHSCQHFRFQVDTIRSLRLYTRTDGLYVDEQRKVVRALCAAFTKVLGQLGQKPEFQVPTCSEVAALRKELLRRFPQWASLQTGKDMSLAEEMELDGKDVFYTDILKMRSNYAQKYNLTGGPTQGLRCKK